MAGAVVRSLFGAGLRPRRNGRPKVSCKRGWSPRLLSGRETFGL